MILNINTVDKEFIVTRNPEAKLDQNGNQRNAKEDGFPLWRTQVVVTDVDGGEVITINTSGLMPPDVKKGEDVNVLGLVAKPWVSQGRSGVAFVAEQIKAIED